MIETGPSARQTRECGSSEEQNLVPSSHSSAYVRLDHSITAIEYAAYRPPRPHERASTLGDTEGENEWNDAARVRGDTRAQAA